MRHGEPAPEHAQHGDFDNPSRVMLKSPPISTPRSPCGQ
jgi:hypothetical protein